MKLIRLKYYFLVGHVSLLLFFTAAFYSCKKVDVIAPVQSVTERFLTLPANASPQVKRIIEDLKKKNEAHPFIEAFVASYGYPKWQYAKILQPKKKNSNQYAKENEGPEIVEIPIVMDVQKYVDALLSVKMDAELLYKTFLAKDVANLGFDKSVNRTKMNADDMLARIMEYEKAIWNEKYYEIKDNRFFDYWPAGTPKPAVFSVEIKDIGVARVVAYNCGWIDITTVHEWTYGPPTTTTDSYPIICFQFIPDAPPIPWNNDGPSGDEDSPWSNNPGGGGPGGGGGGYGGGNGNEGPCTDLAWSRLQYSPSAQGWFNPCYQIPLQPSTNLIPDVYAEFGNLNQPDNTPDKPIIDNGITVEDTQDPQQQQNSQLLGRTTDRQNTEDLEYGNNDNFNGLDLTDFDESNDGLFGIMTELFEFCSTGELEDVGHSMIEKFRTNTTVDYYYSDNRLNKAVGNSSDLINFLKEFGKELVPEVRRVGNISNIPTIEMEQTRPIFNGAYNKFNGLQILINDTELTEIRHINSRSSGNHWEVEVEITIYDHFGLDKADAIAYQIYHRGFPAWWMLQHLRNFVPYKTKAVFYKTFKFSI